MSEADAPGATTISPERRDFHRRWSTLKPPLRPHENVAKTISGLLPDSDLPVLLLGVTPELAAIPERLIATDWSEAMIRAAWPGDSENRKVMLADWRALPLEQGSVAAAIGDGSLNMLSFPEDILLVLEQLRRVVAEGGRAAIRCFTTAEDPETVEQVRQAALSGSTSFHAFKLRLNMAAAVEAGLDNMPCTRVFQLFERLFPDREELSRRSGWTLQEIAEIDAYRGSPYVQCYPKRSALLGLMPRWVRSAGFVETEDYPLAERCPVLVVDL